MEEIQACFFCFMFNSFPSYSGDYTYHWSVVSGQHLTMMTRVPGVIIWHNDIMLQHDMMNDSMRKWQHDWNYDSSHCTTAILSVPPPLPPPHFHQHQMSSVPHLIGVPSIVPGMSSFCTFYSNFTHHIICAFYIANFLFPFSAACIMTVCVLSERNVFCSCKL